MQTSEGLRKTPLSKLWAGAKAGASLSSGGMLCNKAKEGDHGKATILDLVVLNSVPVLSLCVQTEAFIV